MSLLALLFMSLFFFSCSENSQSQYLLNYYKSQQYNPDVIKSLKVKSRIKTEIHTNPKTPIVLFADGKDLSPNKVRSIEYFNERGLCYLVVTPSFKMMQNDTTGYSKLSATDQLFFPKEIESNEPTGFYDSTFNYFDENNYLTKSVEKKTTSSGFTYIDYTTVYSYDKKGNLVKRCFDSENSSSFCSFTFYKYDSYGKIISTLDSFSVDIRRPDMPNKGIRKFYSYDSKGRISSINDLHFLYNEKNLIKEEYILSGPSKVDIKYHFYDESNNRVKEEHISPILSSIDPKTNLIKAEDFDTSISLSQYNIDGLIIESSFRRSKKIPDYSLYKYTYNY